MVTDNSGAVLPGVTVTATSPALQVPSVTSVSDERGEYRLSPLPIGVYTVLFELAGFQNVRREGVRLTVGFTARVDAEMNVGAVSETITVSGASPLVDTTSTATSTELTREQLEVLPTSRDGFHAFMNQVPGVRTNLDVGSSGLGDTVLFKFHGQYGSPWQMLEGVLASAPTATGDAGQPRGLQRDRRDARADGGQQRGDAAARPAGRFRDQIRRQRLSRHVPWRTGRAGSSRATTSTTTLAAAGIRKPALHKVQDFAGTVGGRIIRNKLWFFGGARYQNVTRDILDAFDPDGTPIANVKEGMYHFEKISYQMSPANRITGFYHMNNDIELRNATKFIPRESMLDKDNPTWMTKAEWQAVRGNSLVTSVQYGQWDFNGQLSRCHAGQAVDDRHCDPVCDRQPFHTGAQPQWAAYRTAAGATPRASSAGTSRTWLGGNHEFKAGVDHLWSWVDDEFVPRKRVRLTSCGSTTACPSRSPRRTRRSKGRTTATILACMCRTRGPSRAG